MTTDWGKDRIPPPQLGDAPIEKYLRAPMNALAQTIDEFLNGDPDREFKIDKRENGFVLLVFPFNGPEGARCNFISNGADRKDVVSLMKEMIARFEGQPEMKGRA